MDMSSFSLVIIFFSPSRSYTSVTDEKHPLERSDSWGASRVGGGGGGGSQGKWCFQAPETQFFQNGLQSGVFFFLNVGLSFSYGRTKTEAFQNDHSIHVIQRKVRDAIVFHSLYRFRVEGQKRLAYATCVRVFFRKRRKISSLSKILDTCGHERGLTFTVLLIAIRYYLQLWPAFLARLPRTEPHTHRIRSTSFRLVVTWLTERTYSSIDCTGGVGETIKRKGMPWQIHISYIGHSQYGQLTAVKTG